mmetsp:Transcript_17242/g.31158  ORF Transcript_17242/g.31158 Transcript_17242/m.31158 type:complete len:449 (+) Transcript_17242:35-1381(+)
MVDAEENVISASGSSTADAENKAQDPLLAATAAVAAADGHDEQSKSVTDALSSMAVTTDDGAASNDDSIPPPPPEQQQQPPAIAQQLPINLPANLDELDDEAAAALDNEFLSLLPPCILPRIDKLKSLNVKRDEILDEYRVERAMLEKKFSAIMQPLYEERKAVVIGEFDGAIGEEAKKLKVDVAEEGVVEDVNDEEDSAGGGGGQQDVRGIPQFWACAMGHVDVIAELITEADVDCLDHLVDITCQDFPDGLGFELHFHFSPNNPFFKNTTLSKRYEVPNLLTEDEPILKNVTGTTIQWKPDQCLTHREVTKKQRKKGGPNAGQIRTLKKKERVESFFHFFTPPKMPALMDVMDEEEADAVEEAFDHDYDVAQAVRGHLIPKAVLWFTGEAMMIDDEGFEEEMMLAQGGGGAEGGPQQFEFNGGSNGSNPFPPPAAGEGENPECKQN